MKQYLLPQALTRSGVKTEQIKIEDDALNNLIKYYCRESGVRSLQKHVEKVCVCLRYSDFFLLQNFFNANIEVKKKFFFLIKDISQSCIQTSQGVFESDSINLI